MGADDAEIDVLRGVLSFMLIFLMAWAFFWPDRFGAWLGAIVHAFRAAAGG